MDIQMSIDCHKPVYVDEDQPVVGARLRLCGRPRKQKIPFAEAVMTPYPITPLKRSARNKTQSNNHATPVLGELCSGNLTSWQCGLKSCHYASRESVSFWFITPCERISRDLLQDWLIFLKEFLNESGDFSWVLIHLIIIHVTYGTWNFYI